MSNILLPLVVLLCVAFLKMNTKKIILLLLCFHHYLGSAQTLRYFEFKTLCFTSTSNTWEDSSFIAATSNSLVIDSIVADLNRPDTLRKMILGPVDFGNAGYNHNASHWFLWHFVENQWQLTEGAIELCDGCPTNVDVCVSCFISIHSFCPWSSHVVREVFPTSINDPSSHSENSVFPNPFSKETLLHTNTWVTHGCLYLMISRVNFYASKPIFLAINLSFKETIYPMVYIG